MPAVPRLVWQIAKINRPRYPASSTTMGRSSGQSKARSLIIV